ncbi:MAG: glycosyltransferase family 2 protein [Candidatus Gracilibacteria bacterium]|nr:glycosyltransferase family 2 protein [Candidatus Gracilibacteria bacterium]
MLKVNYLVGVFFIAFYISYWTIKILQTHIYVIISYIKLLKTNKKNFCDTEIIQKEAKKLKHIVILPFYNEPYELIDESVFAIIENDYPHKENITVILAPEERKEGAVDIAIRVCEKYKNLPISVQYVSHPDKLPGEGRVKGSNISYAAKTFTEGKNLDLHWTFVSAIDCDAKVEKNFFLITSYVFLTTEKRDNAIYQYTPVYSNNWGRGKFFAKLVAMGTTFWQLAESQNPEFYRNFAIYGQSLYCLKKSDYWSKTSIVEDGFQYWRSYFAFDGIFRIVNTPAVCRMDMVEESGFFTTIGAQYKQLRRWSWGSSDMEFVIPEFIKNKKIPLIDKIRKTIYLVFNHLFWAAGSLMLFFIGYLPGVFGDRSSGFTNLAVPIGTSFIFTGIFLTVIIPGILSIFIMKKYTKFRKRDYVYNILQRLLVPIFSMTLFSFPAIESQFRLFFGKRLDEFNVTKKKR